MLGEEKVMVILRAVEGRLEALFIDGGIRFFHIISMYPVTELGYLQSHFSSRASLLLLWL